MVSPPRVFTSSWWTALMTCCAGLRASLSCSPTRSSWTRAMKPLTTLKLTSASRRARRISRRTSSTSSSVSRPLRPRREKIPSKRSESASNMDRSCYRLRRAGPSGASHRRASDGGAHRHLVVDALDTGDGPGHAGQLLTGVLAGHAAAQDEPAGDHGDVGLIEVPRAGSVGQLEGDLVLQVVIPARGGAATALLQQLLQLAHQIGAGHGRQEQ